MKQDNFEEKKQMPRRASRGVRNQQTEEQQKKDDKFYESLFGNLDQSSEDDSSFQCTPLLYAEQIGLRPMEAFSANFANYNYGRGYHYFFNLDTFPRVEGSPSYALDDKNRFKFTYSQDETQVNGIKLKKLFNRHYIGLPTIETTYGNSKSKDKNVCHYHLFNTEDKKYYNHRLISKYRYVLNHLERLCESGKISTYTEFKKDIQTYEVCEKQTSFHRRRQILENRIKVLEERVKNTSSYWHWEDQIYFPFSLDQIFHNQALSKGQMLSLRHLKQRIFTRILSRKNFIQSTEEGSVTLGALKPKFAVQNWLFFEEEVKKTLLSEEVSGKLKNSTKLIEMFKRKEELVIFPLFLFNLENSERAVDCLLKAKLQNEHETGFYIYKAFVKKLFRRDLLSQEEPLKEPVQTEEYSTVMRRKLEEIEIFYDERLQEESSSISIDEVVEITRIQNSPIDEHITLLNSQHKTQITLKQLMILFFYRNISVALTKFIDYINCDPEILKLMVDSNYEKYHYGISKILHQHEFCILMNDIQRLAEVLNASDICPEFDQTLYFNFDKKIRTAWVWVQNESDEWETDKEDQDGKEEERVIESRENALNDGEGKPTKKVKID